MSKTYTEKLAHPLWQKRRLEIMGKAGFKCQKCGDGNEELHVHHIKYRSGRQPWEYKDSELICLCHVCHAEEHKRGKVAPSEAPIMTLNDFITIKSPDEWRGMLMSAAVAVLDGRVNIAQANSVIGLSTEVHKSLRQEWDMRRYVSESITINHGRLIRLEEPDDIGTTADED